MQPNLAEHPTRLTNLLYVSMTTFVGSDDIF